MTSMALLALSAAVAPAFAQGDVSLHVCDGTKQPNWNDCEDVLDDLGWRDATPGIDVIDNDQDGSCSNICRSYTKSDNSKNCEISVCFYTETCVSAAQSDFVAVYDNIMKQYCKPLDAGATYTGGDIEYFAWLNPDYVPPSTGDKRDVLERDVAGLTMSTDAFEERLNATARQPDEAHQKDKRDDDTWVTISVSKSVGKDGDRRQASSILSSGSKESWSFSETETVSVSTSIEMGAGWEIFTASVGITTEQSYSTTIESGQQFTSGNCPKGGIVYYVPLWTNYLGYWESNENEVISVWIPETNGKGKSVGKFETDCVG
ncbi:hypothetical protein CC79DRAFT_1372567 [Sarocladium strictum]